MFEKILNIFKIPFNEGINKKAWTVAVICLIVTIVLVVAAFALNASGHMGAVLVLGFIGFIPIVLTMATPALWTTGVIIATLPGTGANTQQRFLMPFRLVVTAELIIEATILTLAVVPIMAHPVGALLVIAGGIFIGIFGLVEGGYAYYKKWFSALAVAMMSIGVFQIVAAQYFPELRDTLTTGTDEQQHAARVRTEYEVLHEAVAQAERDMMHLVEEYKKPQYVLCKDSKSKDVRDACDTLKEAQENLAAYRVWRRRNEGAKESVSQQKEVSDKAVAVQRKKAATTPARKRGDCAVSVRRNDDRIVISFPTCYEGMWHYDLPSSRWFCEVEDTEVVWHFGSGGMTNVKKRPTSALYGMPTAATTNEFSYPIKGVNPFALHKAMDGKRLSVRWNVQINKALPSVRRFWHAQNGVPATIVCQNKW